MERDAPRQTGKLDEQPELFEIPISALAHWAYCPRRVALIHVEQTFDENVFTVRGRAFHERADFAPTGTRGQVRVIRHLPLTSARYGLTGKADIVELRDGVPFPVEYKLGGLKGRDAAIQLCAQAFCLEEQFGQPVPAGAVYSHATRRRRSVRFDAELRATTEGAIVATREIIERQLLPPPLNDAHCPRCSLVNACLPGVLAARARLRGSQAALYRPIDGITASEEWA